MLSYRRITLKDREWIDEKLRESGFRGSEYCFVNQLLWGGIYGMQAALTDGVLCTRYPAGGGRIAHDFPAGNGDREAAIWKMVRSDSRLGCVSVLRAVTDEQLPWLEETFAGKFRVFSDRDAWDYLYPVEQLAKLQGKRFHGKRNHIARFEEAGSWRYEGMSRERIPACLAMYHDWLTQNRERLEPTILQERFMVEGALKHFEELKLQGGLLLLNGEIIAFCLGEPLNGDTFIVHVEKADTRIQGAYPMINRQFVLHNMQGYTYVNREDDLGVEGLRRSKLSYYPQPLLEKYRLEWIGSLAS